MENINIICVDDQRTVLSTLTSELKPFESYYQIEACESADEALALMDELDQDGEKIALIISDHVMPGKTGVEFLTEVHHDGRFPNTRKILLTGLATHKDTIEAINQAQIDQYLEKPYDKDELIQSVKKWTTQFILKEGIDYKDFTAVLDSETLLKGMRNSSI